MIASVALWGVKGTVCAVQMSEVATANTTAHGVCQHPAALIARVSLANHAVGKAAVVEVAAALLSNQVE